MIPRSSRIAAPGPTSFLLLLAACSSAGAPRPEVDLAPVEASVSPEVGAQTITPEEMLAHISFLASDELGGRDTPSPGLEKAAVYIRDSFRDAGLEPAGDEGSFMQRWTFERTTLSATGVEVAVVAGGEIEDLEFGTDFFVLPSAEEDVGAAGVFLGSVDTLLGDSLPDATGRIAIVTTPPSMGMEILQATRAAADAGAIGLVLILHQDVPSEVVGMVAGQISGSGLPLQPVPTVGMPWQLADRLLERAGFDLDDLSAPVPDGGEGEATVTLLDDLDLTIRAPLDRETSTPPNVVGLVRGSDPELADTYVVLSAHFDHVGIGEPNAEGDSIYNGADDDASGTSALLEIAGALQAMPRPPARSVVLLAVSGEEKGLLGALHFADHPTVPAGGIVADINLDMIGRNAPDTLIAIGQEYTSLGDLSKQVAHDHPEIGLVLAPDPDPEEMAFFRSDHLAFVRKDIPAIFYTTWDHEDYHQPSDEADKIDGDKAARVTRLAFLVAWQVADGEVAPSWNEGSLEEVHRILEDSPF